MPRKSGKTLTSYFSPDTSKKGDKRACTDLTNSTPSKRMRDRDEEEEVASISPEQADRAQQKKMEAEAKLWAQRLEAGQIGPSWMKILTNEFRQPYFDKVCWA